MLSIVNVPFFSQIRKHSETEKFPAVLNELNTKRIQRPPAPAGRSNVQPLQNHRPPPPPPPPLPPRANRPTITVEYLLQFHPCRFFSHFGHTSFFCPPQPTLIYTLFV